MEQNRKRYSSLAKAIVIGLQMIAAVLASVSIVLFSTCVNQNMLNMGDQISAISLFRAQMAKFLMAVLFMAGSHFPLFRIFQKFFFDLVDRGQ